MNIRGIMKILLFLWSVLLFILLVQEGSSQTVLPNSKKKPKPTSESGKNSEGSRNTQEPTASTDPPVFVKPTLPIPDFPEIVSSPDGDIQFLIHLSLNNCLQYEVTLQNRMIVGLSTFFYEFQEEFVPICDVKLVRKTKNMVNELWKPIYGPRSEIPNNYNELILSFTGMGNDLFVFNIRVFNEGVGFRFVFENPGGHITFDSLSPEDVVAISTKLNLTVDKTGILYQDMGGEYGIKVHKLQELNRNPWLWNISMHPFTVQFENEFCLSVTEAKNVEYSPIRFFVLSPGILKARFEKMGFILDHEATTPWFTFVIAPTSSQLVERSFIVDNLNDPCVIEDTSWILPGKVFRDISISTSGSKEAIDFASRSLMPYVLLDAGWYGPEHDEKSDPRTWAPVPKTQPLDIPTVLAYAKSKNIGVWLYVNDSALEKYLNDILERFVSWGIKGIKFGFVRISTSKDVERILGYVRLCAQYKLMVNIHDILRPTGYSRTYPNLVSIEGIRGDEHRETSTHALLLPFTRFIGGMADNTFIFDPERLQKMNKSVTHQIALALILSNPLSHLFWYLDPWVAKRVFSSPTEDLPHVKVWQMMPKTWENTKVLKSKIGEYITVARQAENGMWFLASATRVHTKYEVRLDFLSDKNYEMEIYIDDPENRFSKGKLIGPQKVTKGATLMISMIDSGGEVATFHPKD